MSDLRPIKWKRRFGAEAGKPVETLRQLRGRSLRGVLAHGCAYVAVDGKTASLLDRVCLGRAARGVAASGVADAWLQELAQRLLSERSAREAADAGAAAAPLLDRPRPPPLVALVRFSLLEAVFLVHGLECLTLFEEAVRAHARCASRHAQPLTAPAQPPGGQTAAASPGVHDEAALGLWASAETARELAEWRTTGVPPPSLHAITGSPPPAPPAPPAVAPADAATEEAGAASAEAQAEGEEVEEGEDGAADDGLDGEAPSAHAHDEQPLKRARRARAPAGDVPAGMRALTDGEVWDLCVAYTPGFGPAYAAYHHCRARGWLVRSGLQYGADYVLYPRHPSVSHSTLCALVVPPPEGPGSDSGAAAAVRAGWPVWPELQALSRLCVQVNKGLLVLHVIAAADDHSQGATSALRAAQQQAQRATSASYGVRHPSVRAPTVEAQLERLRVLEVEVSRWNPNKGRQEATITGL